MIRNLAVMIYAVVGYLSGTAGLIALIVFQSDWLPHFSPDAGPARTLVQALAINTAAMSIWGLQHLGMARPAFKRMLERSLPSELERSTYMLFTGLAVAVVVLAWTPIPVVVFEFHDPKGIQIVRGLYLFGWAYAVSAILYDSYLEFHGLKQAYYGVRGLAFTPAPFKSGYLFALSRRPTFFGILIASWATPTLTVGRLQFAVMMTAILLIGAFFVERTYVTMYGDAYREVQRTRPLIVPNPLLILERIGGGSRGQQHE